MKSKRREIDRIFNLVNKMCYECDASGDWTPIDNLLKEVDVSTTDTIFLLSWLTITSCVRSKLPHRAKLVEAIKEKLKDYPAMDAKLVGLE